MLAVMEGSRASAADAHAAWSESFNELFAQVAGVFSNAHVRRHGRAYVLGLLSQTERKTSWQLAEFAGEASPDGMQRLLNFSPWDEDACRDAVARYVMRSHGRSGRGPGGRRDGIPEKGADVGGRGQAIYRDGGPGGELPGRRVPGVLRAGRGAGADRPRAVHPEEMGGGPGAVPRRPGSATTWRSRRSRSWRRR